MPTRLKPGSQRGVLVAVEVGESTVWAECELGHGARYTHAAYHYGKCRCCEAGEEPGGEALRPAPQPGHRVTEWLSEDGHRRKTFATKGITVVQFQDQPATHGAAPYTVPVSIETTDESAIPLEMQGLVREAHRLSR